MRRVAAMFCMAFFMAITCIIGISQADMVINLDASDNPDHPTAWTNLGTAGGSFLGNDDAPTLEEGTIEIPATRVRPSLTPSSTPRRRDDKFGAAPSA